MVFEPFGLENAWLLRLEPHHDNRGFLARSWAPDEFAARGLNTDIAHCSISYNRQARTLRGMHYQAPPHEEAKVVRCIRGAIYDVLVDLRRDSPTFGRWQACELTAENRLSLYVPEGVAHGFQTLTDEAEVFYMISAPYDASLARGVRWNDPAFGIVWPAPPGAMSDRDRSFPDYAL